MSSETTPPDVNVLASVTLPGPTAASDNALASPTPGTKTVPGAEAVVITSPLEFFASLFANAVPPTPPKNAPPPPVEFAVAEAGPVVLDAVALEAAAPPLPPRPGKQLCIQGKIGAPPRPPFPPVEVAVAEAEPFALDAIAVELAAPPWPPAPGP
jgi:hypothetical protein